VSAKYSLEALRTLRAAREQAFELSLSERERELERRRLEQREEAAVLENIAEERRRERALEAEALSSDAGLCAADLVHGVEHDAGRVALEQRQRARVESAETEVQKAAAERERVAAELRTAQAEHEAVARHRERWQREQARIAEEAADESATERWNVQNTGPGRT
jgi:hypothetical protein